MQLTFLELNEKFETLSSLAEIIRRAETDEIPDDDEVDLLRERLRMPPWAMSPEQFFDRETRIEIYTDRVDLGYSPMHPDDGKLSSKPETLVCYLGAPQRGSDDDERAL